MLTAVAAHSGEILTSSHKTQYLALLSIGSSAESGSGRHCMFLSGWYRAIVFNMLTFDTVRSLCLPDSISRAPPVCPSSGLSDPAILGLKRRSLNKYYGPAARGR